MIALMSKLTVHAKSTFCVTDTFRHRHYEFCDVTYKNSTITVFLTFKNVIQYSSSFGYKEDCRPVPNSVFKDHRPKPAI